MRSLHERQVLGEHAGVDREVVDALLRLVLEHVDEGRRRVMSRRRPSRSGAPGRSGTVPIGHGRGGDDGAADAVDVAAGREVHHRVGAVLERRCASLSSSPSTSLVTGAVADVRVDLARERRCRCPSARGSWWLHVGRDDHAARGRPRSRTSSGSSFSRVRDVRHLLGDDALRGRSASALLFGLAARFDTHSVRMGEVLGRSRSASAPQGRPSDRLQRVSSPRSGSRCRSCACRGVLYRNVGRTHDGYAPFHAPPRMTRSSPRRGPSGSVCASAV